MDRPSNARVAHNARAEQAPRVGAQRAKIRIGTLNVDSLISRAYAGKVVMVNAVIHSLNLDILLLQDTHLTNDSAEERGVSRFKNLDFANHCPDQGSRGVMTIINRKRMSFVTKNVAADEEGRLLVSALRFQDEVIFLANVYLPPSPADRVEWLGEMTEAYAGTDVQVDIAAGDWNMVEKPGLDREGSVRSEARDRRDVVALQNFLNCLRSDGKELIDGWRQAHPSSREYTHTNRGQAAKSRIDRIYVREDMASVNGRDWTIEPAGAIHTDHRMPVLQCPLGEAGPERGPGAWRMTPAVLDYPVIVKELDDIACSVDLSGRMAPLDAWLEIKARLRNQLQVRMETHRKNSGRRRKRLLAKRSRVVTKRSCLERTRELEQYDLELDALAEWESYQYASTAMSKEHILGERPSKYFYAKTRAQARRSGGIRGLINSDGLESSDPEQMCDIAHKFYSELYNEKLSDRESRNRVLELVTEKIGNEAAKDLIAPISEREVRMAIRRAAHGKAAGVDGLMAELYKRLIARGSENNRFIKTLLGAFQDAQSRRVLPSELTQCYTAILNKYEGVAGKNPADLKNYRPLSLMNVDYKLYTAILMRRLTVAINPVIGQQQYAFLTGRQIGDNIKLIQCLIDKYSGTGGGAQILFLDSEKAYDRVSHSFLWSLMEKMGIPPQFIRTTQALYEGKTTKVNVNGFFSEAVQVKSGVGQGDPLSCPLYLIAVEGRALMLEHSAMRGVRVGDDRITDASFADDIAILNEAEASRADEPVIMDVLATYDRASGNRTNYGKSVIMMIGQGEPYGTLVERGCRVIQEGTSYVHLGIPVGVGIAGDIEAFWTEKQVEMAKISAEWLKFHMSSRGRILISKAKIISLAKYALQFLPLSDRMLSRMEKVIWALVWNGKDRGDICRRGALLTLAKGGRNCHDLGVIRSATAMAQVVRMEWHPELPWVKLAVRMMADHVIERGRTWGLVNSQYTEPWKQHSGRARVSMPQSIGYIWEGWWGVCPYRRFQTANELVRFVEPSTAEEVLNTKHWYYPDLEELPPGRATRQGAKVWSSPTWQRAGEGAYGSVTTIGDLWDPVAGTSRWLDTRNRDLERMDSAARHMVQRVLPRRWWQLIVAMTAEQAAAWERSNKERFEHCLIMTNRKKEWYPLRKTSYREICNQMVQALVKDVNFGQVLEGPRRALAAMLQREVPHSELWKEIR